MSTYSDWVQVELTRAFERGQGHNLKLLQLHVAPTDQEANVFNVRIESAIQLAERNGVWVENIHSKRAKLPHKDASVLRSYGYGSELRNRDWLHVNLHLICDARYCTLQIVRRRVIADVVYIQCGAWTTKHTQRTTAQQEQGSGLGVLLAQCLQKCVNPVWCYVSYDFNRSM